MWACVAGVKVNYQLLSLDVQLIFNALPSCSMCGTGGVLWLVRNDKTCTEWSRFEPFLPSVSLKVRH